MQSATVSSNPRKAFRRRACLPAISASQELGVGGGCRDLRRTMVHAPRMPYTLRPARRGPGATVLSWKPRPLHECTHARCTRLSFSRQCKLDRTLRDAAAPSSDWPARPLRRYRRRPAPSITARSNAPRSSNTSLGARRSLASGIGHEAPRTS